MGNGKVPTYVLDARMAHDHFPGIGRYVSNLARALVPQLAAKERLVILWDPAQPSRWSLPEPATPDVVRIPVPCSPFSLQQQWMIPKHIRRLNAHVYHSPYYLMPYLVQAPSLVTIYDLIPELFPQHVSWRARFLFKVTTALALRAADRVITISDATRRDLLRYFAIAPGRVSSTLLAPAPHFQPATSAEVELTVRRYDLPQSYALYVGINKPHKNLTRLVRAWHRLDQDRAIQVPSLVIAGHWDERYPQPLQLVEELSMGGLIRFVRSVSDEDLPAVYSGATLFVFPSLYEGFGLPVVEAMSCGCPVACSDTSSLPEIAGDAALLFDATSVESMVEAIKNVLQDEMLRRELAERGKRRAAQFSWERTAGETLAIYRAMAEAERNSRAA